MDIMTPPQRNRFFAALANGEAPVAEEQMHDLILQVADPANSFDLATLLPQVRWSSKRVSLRVDDAVCERVGQEDWVLIDLGGEGFFFDLISNEVIDEATGREVLVAL